MKWAGSNIRKLFISKCFDIRQPPLWKEEVFPEQQGAGLILLWREGIWVCVYITRSGKKETRDQKEDDDKNTVTENQYKWSPCIWLNYKQWQSVTTCETLLSKWQWQSGFICSDYFARAHSVVCVCCANVCVHKYLLLYLKQLKSVMKNKIKKH